MKTLTRQDTKQLDRIRKVFDLSEHELAMLLGVQRQSVTEWREKGIPSVRRASVERLVDLANVFARELIDSRIPQIVRTPDAWLEDRSILDTIRIHGPEVIYSYLRVLFSYDGS